MPQCLIVNILHFFVVVQHPSCEDYCRSSKPVNKTKNKPQTKIYQPNENSCITVPVVCTKFKNCD